MWKSENPNVLLTLFVAHELSVLCMIGAFALKGGKMELVTIKPNDGQRLPF